VTQFTNYNSGIRYRPAILPGTQKEHKEKQVQDHFKLTSIAVTLALGYCAAASQGAYADSGAGVGPLLTFSTETFPAPAPVVARSSGGRFAVSWAVQDNGMHRVAQIYNADGTAASAVFPIGAGSASNAALAMDKDGDLVAAWYDVSAHSLNGYTGAIHAQRYTPAGAAQGGEIYVAPAADGAIVVFTPDLAPLHVAADDDGDFAIAWTQGHSFILPTGVLKGWVWQSSKTTMKVYDNKGHLLKSKAVDTVPAKSSLLGYGGAPSYNFDRLDGLAMNGKGDMVLVYTSARGTQPTQMLAQHLDLKLTQVPTPVALDGADTFFTGVGIDSSDNFVLATYGAYGGTTLTLGRYSANGVFQGSPDTLTGVNGAGTTLSENANGSYVATWNVEVSLGQDSSGYDQFRDEKHAQYFHSDGSANGAEMVIDDGQSQFNSATSYAAGDASNNLVVLWTAGAVSGVEDTLVGRLVTAP
jgi:hypothetical protein